MEEIIQRISFATGMSEEEIKEKIEEKKLELSGLISDEGAAYLVAKEVGVDIVQQQKLNIESLVAGMQNVDIIGKVVKISPVREFNTEKSQGKVANMFLADETGSVRVSLWNDEIEKIEGIKEGDVVRIKGYVKDNNISGPEIRLGRYGIITKSEEKIENIKNRTAERSKISELRENNYKEVRAALVQVFEGSIFYEICPQCKSRLKEEKDYKCEEHGDVQPEYGIIITGIIDDGSGNMRAVFFNENAEKIIGMTKNDAKKLFDRKKKLDAVLEHVSLGKDFILTGKVRRNSFFDRLEFVVSDVKEVEIKKEIELIMNS